MKIRKLNISEIISFLGSAVKTVYGAYDGIYINNLTEIDHVNITSLDWVNPSKPEKQKMAENSKARVLLVDETVFPIDGKILIVVEKPKVCLAKIGNEFFVEKMIPSIHPTAIIDDGAIIGRNCYIGPYCVIAKAIIGDNCQLEGNINVCDDVELGHDCIIKTGAVLGGVGFGFERDEEGNRFRFPQIGQLIMGNYVEVGANTCVDRGALSDTVIGDYTKISNLCQIAHNNKIGKNVFIGGCAIISGSNVIDDNVWIAPNASIRGWVHIGKGAMVGIGTVVVKDIPAKETWVGNPAKKIEKK